VLAIAKGEIIALTDAECEVSPDWLSQIYEGLRGATAAAAMGKKSFPAQSSSALKVFQDYENVKLEYLLTCAMKAYYFGCADNIAFKAHLFKDLDGFREEPWMMGDSEMVQRLVSKYPGSEIVYLPRTEINHLEIVSVWTWMGKLYHYGQYNRYVKMADNGYKELGVKERLGIFRCLIRTKRYSFGKSLWAILVLMAGSFFYMAGQAKSFSLAFLNPGNHGR